MTRPRVRELANAQLVALRARVERDRTARALAKSPALCLEPKPVHPHEP
jgi:hypothetical protein